MFEEKIMGYYTLKQFTDILRNKGYEINRNKLRHYEREGLIKPSRQQHGEREYRYYSDEDIETVRVISRLISLSWNAKDVAALLKISNDTETIVRRAEEVKSFLKSVINDEDNTNDKKKYLKDLDFWKKIEETNQFEIEEKIIKKYSKSGLDRKEIKNNSTRMLEQIQDAKVILDNYVKKIKKMEEKIIPLYSEIHYLLRHEAVKRKM